MSLSVIDAIGETCLMHLIRLRSTSHTRFAMIVSPHGTSKLYTSHHLCGFQWVLQPVWNSRMYVKLIWGLFKTMRPPEMVPTLKLYDSVPYKIAEYSCSLIHATFSHVPNICEYSSLLGSVFHGWWYFLKEFGDRQPMCRRVVGTK